MIRYFYVIFSIISVANFSFGAINKSGIKAATSKAEYCRNASNPDYFKSLFYSTQNHISFTNQGGLMNGGVCWWHSMMTRAVQYLTVYRPELPKPSRDEAAKIIQYLTVNKGVVEIPGYQNFYQFSLDHENLILSALEGWQIADGGFGLGFLRGISGSHIVEPSVLKKMMDDTYKLVKQKKQVAYQKLQIEGITAHAWLVVDMTKTNNGYTLDVVDSNYRGIGQVHYFEGMSQLSTYSSVPYTSRNSIDYRSFDFARKQYCRYGKTAADMDTSANLYN